ncbi:hypothetical protein HDE_08505 [Halotydeus destructor]|nr:hypothetical protein HDE_08505 [Halotydeus destructor]
MTQDHKMAPNGRKGHTCSSHTPNYTSRLRFAFTLWLTFAACLAPVTRGQQGPETTSSAIGSDLPALFSSSSSSSASFVPSASASSATITLTVSSGNKTSAFVCPEQFGYYDDMTDCSKYFVCVFGEALHETCTGGLHFSPELQTCDWPRNVKCAEKSASSPSSQAVQQVVATTAKSVPGADAKKSDPVADILYDDQFRPHNEPSPNGRPLAQGGSTGNGVGNGEDEDGHDLQRSRSTVQHNFHLPNISAANDLQPERRAKALAFGLSPVTVDTSAQPPSPVVMWSPLLNGTLGGNKADSSEVTANRRQPVVMIDENYSEEVSLTGLESSSSLASAGQGQQRGPDRRRGIPFFQQQRLTQQQHFQRNPSSPSVIMGPAGSPAQPPSDQGQSQPESPKRQDFGTIMAFNGYPSFDGTPEMLMMHPLVSDNYRGGQAMAGQMMARPRVAPLGPRVPERMPFFVPDDKAVFFDDDHHHFDMPKPRGQETGHQRHFTQPPPGVFREMRPQSAPPTPAAFRPTSAPRITPAEPALRAPSNTFGHASQFPAPGPPGRHRPPYGGFEERHPAASQRNNNNNHAPAQYVPHTQSYFDRQPPPPPPASSSSLPPAQADLRAPVQPMAGGDHDQDDRHDPRGSLSDAKDHFRAPIDFNHNDDRISGGREEAPSRPQPVNGNALQVKPVSLTNQPPQSFVPQPRAPAPKLPPPPAVHDEEPVWEWERTRTRPVPSSSTNPVQTQPPRLPTTQMPRDRFPTETTYVTEPTRTTQSFPDFVEELRRPQSPPPNAPATRVRTVVRQERPRPVVRPPPEPRPAPVREAPIREEPDMSGNRNAGIPTEHGQPFGLLDYNDEELDRLTVAPTRPTTTTTVTQAPTTRQRQTTQRLTTQRQTTPRQATQRQTPSPRFRATTPMPPARNAQAAPTDRPRRRKAKKPKVHQLAHLPQRSAARPNPLYPTPVMGDPATKCDPRTCRLPDCNCGNTKVPGNMAAKDIPQIVLLTFDDAVNDLNWETYQELFETGRQNPNGCPLSATFYVSHEWTDYSQVQTLYSKGHEMASHGVTHSFGEKFSKNQWVKEIHGQREILHLYGGVKMEDIRGMRAPFLQIGGNRMFEMLHEANFTYDSSMPVFDNNPPMWPYTLDYAINHECMIAPCPTKSYPGVWEVGMVMWEDLRGGRCSMGDACSNPSDEDGVYQMLKRNFNRHYNSNRAPFGLFYHSAWFQKEHHKKGFVRFMDDILEKPDVYFTTNYQMIQWMRDPVPTSQIDNFEPWDCRKPDPERPPACTSPAVCNVSHGKDGSRFLKTCQPCPTSYPWVGNNGFQKKVSAAAA